VQFSLFFGQCSSAQFIIGQTAVTVFSVSVSVQVRFQNFVFEKFRKFPRFFFHNSLVLLVSFGSVEETQKNCSGVRYKRNELAS